MRKASPKYLPPGSDPSNEYQHYYMLASVPHLEKHSWNAGRSQEEEEEGESCPLPLTHITQSIPHQGQTNTSARLESSSLNRRHKSQKQQVGEPHLYHSAAL